MSLISQSKKRIAGEDDSSVIFPDENEESKPKKGSDLYKPTHKKRRRREAEIKEQMEDNEKIKDLESMLFGSLYSPVEFGSTYEEVDEEKAEEGKLPLGTFLDRSAHGNMGIDEDRDDEDEEEEDVEDDEETPEVSPMQRSTIGGFTSHEEDSYLQNVGNDDCVLEQRKPAWVDEEEEKTSINVAKVNRLRKLRKEEDENVISGSTYVSRLRAHHVKMNPGTEWAQLDGKARGYSSSDDEDPEVENGVGMAPGYRATRVEDILRTTEDLVVNSSRILPGILGYSRLVDANSVDPSSGPINSVHFHREGNLLLTAGLDRKLRFFQVDGKRNPRVDSIFLEDCPVRKASFLPDGTQVIVSGRRKFFYCFDIIKGRYDKVGPLAGREEKSLECFEVSPDSRTIAFLGNEGYILLVSAKSKELIGTLKMNGTARSMAFTHDGQQLLSTGGDGQVYHWDLRTRTCVNKGVDEGCINGTALCTSPLGNLFAAGSSSGIVNIYNQDDFIEGKKKPLKTIENLTTKVDFMKFNHDAQILAICSSMKKSSLKLVHVPSFTVFSNWPPPNANLHYPRCLDFSPGGGFMSVGNSEGKVLLYRLHHYHQA